MKITIKIALIFSLIWIIIKLLYHFLLPNSINLNLPILTNILCLTLTISIGLFLQKKTEGFSSGNLLSDIKSGLTSGMIYSLIVSIFILLYYSTINPSFNKKQISEATLMITKTINNPKLLAELKKSNESFEVMDKKQIFEELQKGPKNFYNSKSTFVITLLSLVLFSTFNAILISIIYRRFLTRK